MKSRVLRSVHKLIYRCWVDPLQRRVADLAGMKPGWRRRALLGSAMWGANAGRLAISDFRVCVKRLRGRHWSVVYVGAGFSFEELRHILFPTPPELEELPRVFLWQIPTLVANSAGQYDLVVCELNRVVHWRPRGACVFTVPSWIRQVIDVARPVENILADMNQNRRRNLREMEKQGFSYVFTQEEKDFDVFYQRMYQPYIYKRHGARAKLSGYDPLYRRFKQGGLILVKCDQQLICGMLCQIVGDTCEAGQMGVHEDHFDQVKKGANVALWWFMMDWARRSGLSYFDFGASRARTADGTFNFKRQWGTRVVPERDVHTEWVFYSDGLSPRLRHHLNKQGFISQIEGWHYHVVLLGPGEGLTGAELSGELKRAAKYGLNGVLFISPQTGSVELFHTRQLAVEEAV